ncbi:hypothetical protein TNIN_417041 [Trichonephila inaurata madagascariensis]|uniref:Uncharacterized protein n=1 Tax=Trichonephila inaurata madagascariensis TaxID=2747483 RepID=A0A8X6XZJ4_9ARAC|nr:hypothetical protein TNIN_417041 [Trichonephila inaurata madagascariensis]
MRRQSKEAQPITFRLGIVDDDCEAQRCDENRVELLTLKLSSRRRLSDFSLIVRRYLKKFTFYFWNWTDTFQSNWMIEESELKIVFSGIVLSCSFFLTI